MGDEICEVCKKPDEIIWRLSEAETNLKEYKELSDKTIAANKKDADDRFDRMNTLLIGTLTTGILSVLLLLANIVFKIRT